MQYVNKLRDSTCVELDHADRATSGRSTCNVRLRDSFNYMFGLTIHQITTSRARPLLFATHDGVRCRVAALPYTVAQIETTTTTFLPERRGCWRYELSVDILSGTNGICTIYKAWDVCKLMSRQKGNSSPL